MTSAIIVAAGKSARMGPNADKLFLELNGCPVVAHTWRTFNQAGGIAEIIVVIRDGMQAAFAGVAFHQFQDRWGRRRAWHGAASFGGGSLADFAGRVEHFSAEFSASCGRVIASAAALGNGAVYTRRLSPRPRERPAALAGAALPASNRGAWRR